jgi:hypothetical protein
LVKGFSQQPSLFMADGELELVEKRDSVSPTSAVADRRNDTDIAGAAQQR